MNEREPSERAPLPLWLGASANSHGRASRPGSFWLGLLSGLLAAGLVATGLFVWWRGHLVAPAHVACPEPSPCPLPPACPGAVPVSLARAAAGPSKLTPQPHHAHNKISQPAVSPLPPDAVPEETKRRDDLRAFATTHAGDLKACAPTPNRGPVRRVGAALVIEATGNVAAVQILGASFDSGATACYAERLRRWKFPTELLRGQERLLVNFVL